MCGADRIVNGELVCPMGSSPQGDPALRPALSWADALLRINELKTEIAQHKALIGELVEYLQHEDRCILSHWFAGEPTKDGGYRSMYAGKWYQTKPVDETPKCNCGLDELLEKARSMGITVLRCS